MPECHSAAVPQQITSEVPWKLGHGHEKAGCAACEAAAAVTQLGTSEAGARINWTDKSLGAVLGNFEKASIEMSNATQPMACTETGRQASRKTQTT